MIYCGDIRCKYCTDDNKCKKKVIKLAYVGINSVYQGYLELLKCKSFEESKDYIHIKNLIKELGLED